MVVSDEAKFRSAATLKLSASWDIGRIIESKVDAGSKRGIVEGSNASVEG
jgi:hypothetical protein